MRSWRGSTSRQSTLKDHRRPALFMLVSALLGLDVMQAAYAHAIEEGYRFYSYGDSGLLLPKG